MQATSKHFLPIESQQGQALIECIIWFGLALVLWFGGVRAASTMLARIQAQGNAVVSVRKNLEHLTPTASRLSVEKDFQIGVSNQVREKHSIRIPKPAKHL